MVTATTGYIKISIQ